LHFSLIRKALDSFAEALEPRAYIGFYGGEPLLEFDTIRRTVDHIQSHPVLRRKDIRYGISTNGSLLTDEILRFLGKHGFLVTLSHDGTAQDVNRPSRLNPLILDNLDLLNRLSGIDFETNSVFSPATAGEICRSARFLLAKGVKRCHLTYSIVHHWDSAALERVGDEVRELKRFLLSYYRRHGTVPVGNFQNRPARAVFWCSAGQDRLAVAADGTLWGCRLFADFFTARPGHVDYSKYCLGEIPEFTGRPGHRYSPIFKNYGLLHQDEFFSGDVSCRSCKSLPSCGACPATAAFSTGKIGQFPSWICRMKKAWREEVMDFWKRVRSG
jgi:radical SAM protein with 4Fe4S-binding SPASM domain